jgi:hypothetical protein
MGHVEKKLLKTRKKEWKEEELKNLPKTSI